MGLQRHDYLYLIIAPKLLCFYFKQSNPLLYHYLQFKGKTKTYNMEHMSYSIMFTKISFTGFDVDNCVYGGIIIKDVIGNDELTLGPYCDNVLERDILLYRNLTFFTHNVSVTIFAYSTYFNISGEMKYSTSECTGIVSPCHGTYSRYHILYSPFNDEHLGRYSVLNDGHKLKIHLTSKHKCGKIVVLPKSNTPTCTINISASDHVLYRIDTDMLNIPANI